MNAFYTMIAYFMIAALGFTSTSYSAETPCRQSTANYYQQQGTSNYQTCPPYDGNCAQVQGDYDCNNCSAYCDSCCFDCWQQWLPVAALIIVGVVLLATHHHGSSHGHGHHRHHHSHSSSTSSSTTAMAPVAP